MSSEQLFANGRIAVLSNRLMSVDKYLRLAESNGVVEALRLLAEFGYAVSGCNDCEQVLRLSLDETLKEIKELCTSQSALRFLLCRYDYHNAKVLMKGKYMRQDFSESCFANAFYPVTDMRDAFNNDDYSYFSENMAEACDAIDAEYADGHRSAQTIDRLLDKAYFDDLRHFARHSGARLLVKLADAQINTANISLVSRFKRAGLDAEQLAFWLIEGGSIKPSVLVAFFEGKLTEKDLPEEYRKQVVGGDAEMTLASIRKKLVADYADPLTLQPALQYFYAKVSETELIRHIVADVKNGVDKEKIKEMINANA